MWELQNKLQVWWLRPVIPVLERLKQEDYHEYEVNLSYSVRVYFR